MMGTFAIGPVGTRCLAAAALTLLPSLAPRAAEPDAELRDRAASAMRRGAEFFRTRVAVGGTYLWMYSEDLKQREGEGVVESPTRGWIQPPGTPSVAMSFLRAFEATGDSYYLDAAKETAAGLRRGQLKSGGWTYYVELDPKKRDTLDYRFDGGGSKAKKTTTFDDDTTQSALRFLLRLDQTLKFGDADVHEAVAYALTGIMKAQYPNGAWPQGYQEFPEPDKFPVKPASFRDDWPREWPGSDNYWFRYTFNDNALADVIDTMFEAARTYGVEEASAEVKQLGARCRAAALKAADFILLAQLPEPQPAWAQQYDFEMHPAWARKFEPPSVTGGESQGILRALLRIYRETGDRKYLEPIPRALDYLRRSRLPDGRLARFYEMKTNEPLYFTKDYKLTKSDADLPTHYSFKIGDGTAGIARELEQVAKLSAEELRKPSQSAPAKMTKKLQDEAKAVMAAQDAHGRWVEGGGLKYHRPKDESVRVIRCETFNKNMELLARYLEAARP